NRHHAPPRILIRGGARASSSLLAGVTCGLDPRVHRLCTDFASLMDARVKSAFDGQWLGFCGTYADRGGGASARLSALFADAVRGMERGRASSGILVRSFQMNRGRIAGFGRSLRDRGRRTLMRSPKPAADRDQSCASALASGALLWLAGN